MTTQHTPGTDRNGGLNHPHRTPIANIWQFQVVEYKKRVIESTRPMYRYYSDAISLNLIPEKHEIKKSCISG
jgi:hypothetical protein